MVSCKPSPRFLSTTLLWFAVFVTVCKGDSDPTDGFTAVSLDESNFKLQQPYNLDPSERYSFENGIRKLWVYSNDEPFKQDSDTKPRTEIRMTVIKQLQLVNIYNTDNSSLSAYQEKILYTKNVIFSEGYDYSDGVWQFEGYGYVPSGTTGVSIMQIFGADNQATSIMLRVYDGQLKYYNMDVIEDNIYDRWFRVNVIHTVGDSITVFIDGTQKYVADDKGGSDHYFKFGVYTQEGSSDYMESRWKDVQIYNMS
ncbi:Citrate-binding protein [Rhynchospora pubera]|uniref:Citrate-binding protein n=1 Tax=Rhynchospora pubera TaxID=906938 RepID=A0AAV8DFH5_9POAL|nr:Citrate-binding protein [Rhynchospora pubera]